MNRDVNKVPLAEILAVYCDRSLKKGTHKLSEEEIENHLEQVITLFTNLVDKDLFKMVYQSYLANRLLDQKTVSLESEKTIISKIKMACGQTFTQKIEGMIADLNLAHEKQKEFSQWAKEKGS